MQLRLNITNNSILENLETLLFSKDKDIAKRFMKNFPWEIYEELSPQYEIQVQSSIKIKKVLGMNIFKNIKWIYFWSEQCEFLLPTLDETKKAILLWKDFDKKYVSKDVKQFSFLTPYYGNHKIRERLIENLEYLNENATYINPKTKIVEIIINDFGTLNLLKKYNNLRPIIGRLMIKTLKNPIVDTYGLEKNIHIAGNQMKNKSQNEILNLKKELADNQRKWFSRSALDNDFYLKFLDNLNINRAGLDYMEKHEELYKPNINIDVYYPYALIFVWRLCDTSAIENIKKWYYPTDSVCSRTCWKYDLFIKNLETVWYKIIQRWNSQFKTQIELWFDQDTISKYDNRLIYTPLI